MRKNIPPHVREWLGLLFTKQLPNVKLLYTYLDNDSIYGPHHVDVVSTFVLKYMKNMSKRCSETKITVHPPTCVLPDLLADWQESNMSCRFWQSRSGGTEELLGNQSWNLGCPVGNCIFLV